MIATDGTQNQDALGGGGEPCADGPHTQGIITVAEQRKNTVNGQTRGLMPPWKKGQSGNPKGRPPDKERKVITHALRELLESSVDKHDLAKAMAKVAFKLALSGDFRFFNMILERLDGKVADQVQADQHHTITLRHVKAELPSE